MNLAIEGHSTQGSEVIARLEMLGGINAFNLNGSETNYYYYIDVNNKIYRCLGINPQNYIAYTLEEFLEKFPYKVGDKVTLDKYPCVIIGMNWDCDDIIYYVKGIDFSKGVYSTDKDLQPYKEETMEDKLEQITFDIPDGYEFFGINDDNQVVLAKKQPQYPKTYKECCKIMKIHSSYELELCGRATTQGEITNCIYAQNLLKKINKFQQLLICRDAYWKIAGEQMGLGKPWKPDWNDCAQHKFGLYTLENEIRCINLQVLKNIILVFPTEKMRDAFYENFKELIEQCKELL